MEIIKVIVHFTHHFVLYIVFNQYNAAHCMLYIFIMLIFVSVFCWFDRQILMYSLQFHSCILINTQNLMIVVISQAF